MFYFYPCESDFWGKSAAIHVHIKAMTMDLQQDVNFLRRDTMDFSMRQCHQVRMQDVLNK
ncbi:MAG TPA: hypothetical protein VFG10_16355 [Saprospiraceae bacterium]|nr:hypothetical protein [Saprospiraceae bacterium]